jgi:hypothetical protein
MKDWIFQIIRAQNTLKEVFMKKSLVLLLGLLLTGLAAYALAAADVTGDWEFTMTMGQRGPMTQGLKFVQTGEKLAVTMTRTGRDGNVMETKGEGTVTGNDIEWTVVRTGRDGQEMKIVYKGKIVDANTITGTVQMGQNPVDWKATRKAK